MLASVISASFRNANQERISCVPGGIMNVSAFETSEYIIVITKICILIESQNLEEIRRASNLIIIRSLSLFYFGDGVGHTQWACRWHLCSPVKPVPPPLGVWSFNPWTTRDVPLIVISCSSLSTIPWQKWLPNLCLDAFGNMAPGLLEFPFYHHMMLIIASAVLFLVRFRLLAMLPSLLSEAKRMILSLFHVEGFHTCKDYSLIFPVPFCVYDKSVISPFFFFL